jgi:hypothetical protein
VLNRRKAFEKAANIDQQACELRTNSIQRVMNPLPRGNHSFGEEVCPLAAVAATAGR